MHRSSCCSCWRQVPLELSQPRLCLRRLQVTTPSTSTSQRAARPTQKWMGHAASTPTWLRWTIARTSCEPSCGTQRRRQLLLPAAPRGRAAAALRSQSAWRRCKQGQVLQSSSSPSSSPSSMARCSIASMSSSRTHQHAAARCCCRRWTTLWRTRHSTAWCARRWRGCCWATRCVVTGGCCRSGRGCLSLSSCAMKDV